jgi:hypothetical protein
MNGLSAGGFQGCLVRVGGDQGLVILGVRVWAEGESNISRIVAEILLDNPSL